MAPKKSASPPSADEQVVETSTAPLEDSPELDGPEAPEAEDRPEGEPEESAPAEVPQVYRAQFLDDWRYHHGPAYSDMPKGHIISSNDYDFKRLVSMHAPLALLDEDGDQIQILSPDDFAE